MLRQRFSSDRSHMRTADGTWAAPPPPWPTITSDQGDPNNLFSVWLAVDKLGGEVGAEVGAVVTLEGLRAIVA